MWSRRITSRQRWCVSALLLALVAAAGVGCATSRALTRGREALHRGDYDLAVVELTRATHERPAERGLAAELQQARIRAAELHVARGRRLHSTGKFEDALLELQVAAELNPADSAAVDLLRETRAALRAKVAVTRGDRTQLETLIAHSREASAEHDLPTDVVLPDSLVFRNASARDILTTIGRFAQLNLVFDPTFRDTTLSVDLRHATLDQALTSVTVSSRNFYRVTAPRSIVIVPDTLAKRREYEEEIIRTFYLSNVDLKEAIDLLRVVVDVRRLSSVTGTNAISIKDTPERIAAVSRVLSAIDKARPEVVIDVELIEVDRSKLSEFGTRLASPGAEGIVGSVDVNRSGLTLDGIRNLTRSNVFLSGLPALYYRLLKSDGNTRILANPQLRATEGTAAKASFGERVPVPVTTFAPLAAGGVNTQPITSYGYEDVGVNIDITPRIHHDDEVSLAVKVKISSISGSGFGGLPTFGNREIETTIRLSDGETNMLAGLIRDDERRTVHGTPGLSDIPALGRLFSVTRNEKVETDILLVLTPHIVRVLDLTEEDLRSFRIGRGEESRVAPGDTTPASGAGFEFSAPPSERMPAATPPGPMSVRPVPSGPAGAVTVPPRQTPPPPPPPPTP